MLYREIRLKPGEVRGIDFSVRYRLSEFVAGEKPDGQAQGRILFFDKAGNLLDPKAAPLVFSAKATDWTEVAEKVLVPETATRMSVIVGLVRANARTLDISRISAQPLGEAEIKEALAHPPKPPPAPAQWVSNGDFQKANAAKDWPEGWGEPQPGMSWQTENDAHFLRITSQEPGKSVMLARTIPLQESSRGITLRIRSRTSGVEHGEHEWFDARTIVHFLGQDGKQVPNEGRDLDTVFTHKPAPTDWIDRARFLSVPEGATQVQVRAGLFLSKAGTVDLAEIQVYPVSEADAGLMQLSSAAYHSWKNDEDAASDRKAIGQAQALLAATGNLVPNGSFTQVTKNPAWPDNWGDKPAPGITWEKEQGQSFLRLTAAHPPRTVMLYKMVILPPEIKEVEVTFRYRVTGLVQGDKAPGDARTPLHFLDGTRVGHLENGKDLGPAIPEIIFSPKATGWTTVTRRLAVPAGATKLQLMPALWDAKAGTLDLAEIRVVPMGDVHPK